jgi:hypothetical protein
MKTKIFAILTVVLLAGAITTSTTGCKSLAKAAAKHWTKKQKKKFIAKCKDGTVKRFGDKANAKCGCIAEAAEKKFPKAEDAMAMSVLEMIKIAGDCVK